MDCSIVTFKFSRDSKVTHFVSRRSDSMLRNPPESPSFFRIAPIGFEEDPWLVEAVGRGNDIVVSDEEVRKGLYALCYAVFNV